LNDWIGRLVGATLPAKATINEMTTVASAWTHAQFLNGDEIKGLTAIARDPEKIAKLPNVSAKTSRALSRSPLRMKQKGALRCDVKVASEFFI
jgi:hypothetical protein